MTDDTIQPTGNPENPWGYNNTPKETPTYMGHEIPVINENSSREELLRYIRILEHRLHLTHVFTQRPDNMPKDADHELGAPQPYDIPVPKRGRLPIFDFVTISQNQAQRVNMLFHGIDRVGALEIGEKLYRRQALGDESPD